ncbi:hypothetical protein EPIB1_1829 [Tritonibacter mobilis]|uniref:pentapeptide repeat-containing protein n=1 Tax=Tritonibacter mobilis TaxID=379347 RepID=UPI000F6DF091|nr:pentapeptide repeat-containing protein [Tritonibacter mobilis]VCU58931.1 hypothetical protein EPIB1_1829 [Tritonibacter mobilis]
MPDIPVSPIYLCLVAAFAFVVLPLGILLERPREITRRLRRDLGAEALPEAVFAGFFLLWVVLCAFLFGGLITSLFDLVNELVLTDSADRSETAKVNFRFFLAGIAALTATLGATLAIPVTLFRLRHSQQANETAQNGLIADRLHKAMEALAKDKIVKIDGEEFSDPNIEVRYAALLTLDTLYKEGNPQLTKNSYHDLLRAYLYSNVHVVSRTSVQTGNRRLLRTDVHLALSHISSIPEKPITDLRGITFPDRVMILDLSLGGFRLNVSRMKSCFSQSCHFERVNFRACNWKDSIFSNCTFKHCLFRGNQFLGVKEFKNCVFEGCALRDIDLSAGLPIGVSNEMLLGFYADGSVTLPPDLPRPDHWSDEALDTKEYNKKRDGWRAQSASGT